MGKIVNQTELAQIIGVTDVTLWEWQKAGMPVLKQGERGQANEYDTSAVIAWKIETEVSKVRKESPRDALYKTQQRFLEMQIAEKAGVLVSVAEVEPKYARMILLARQQLLQVPGLLPLDEKARELVDAAIKEALRDLSKYEPSDGNDAPPGAIVGATDRAIGGSLG